VHHHWFAGSVSSVGSSSLTVNVLLTGKHDTELNGQTVTVSVTADSELVSGKDKTPIALGDIKAGDLVGIHVAGEAGSMTAKRIHVFCNCHWIGGTISALGGSSITIDVKRTGPFDTVLADTSVSLTVNASTTFIRGKDKTPIKQSDLKVGDHAGIVFAANGFFRSPSFDPKTATYTAKQVHAWDKKDVPTVSPIAATVPVQVTVPAVPAK
jgi:hypothetical protein